MSTNKVFNAPMAQARKLLEKFGSDRRAGWITDDLSALDSHPSKSEQVTDLYLADLAAKHGARLATLDQAVRHEAVDLIS